MTNDEFILPKSAKPTNGHLSDLDNDGIWSDYSDTDEKNSELIISTTKFEKYCVKRPEFPQFESQLKSIIRKLGGVDASWMSCDGSLKCKTFSDIYLLLKSSDFAAHDLTAPFALCTDTPAEKNCCLFNSKPILVLRRWYDFRPEEEFRCFIKSKVLIDTVDLYRESSDAIPLFRYQSDQNIRPNSMNQYSVPIDLIDIASGSDPVKVMDFIQAVSPEI
ncbi:unnamed protein product [Schistosoma margrebowiei]|uniref:Uncharacterized protein n=1 Tax=Schistosoma margrebowiei TaxID=48269 RepID=A0A3P8G8W2_9TREM|nr:unnamed protein product [Schistosoma margrebowiei]